MFAGVTIYISCLSVPVWKHTFVIICPDWKCQVSSLFKDFISHKTPKARIFPITPIFPWKFHFFTMFSWKIQPIPVKSPTCSPRPGAPCLCRYHGGAAEADAAVTSTLEVRSWDHEIWVVQHTCNIYIYIYLYTYYVNNHIYIYIMSIIINIYTDYVYDHIYIYCL